MLTEARRLNAAIIRTNIFFRCFTLTHFVNFVFLENYFRFFYLLSLNQFSDLMVLLEFYIVIY